MGALNSAFQYCRALVVRYSTYFGPDMLILVVYVKIGRFAFCAIYTVNLFDMRLRRSYIVNYNFFQ